MLDRYAGVKNTFNRTVHTMDFYVRSNDPASIAANERLAAEFIKDGKEALLNASSTDHTMKLYKVNNPEYYKDVMSSVWKSSGEVAKITNEAGAEIILPTKEKGFLTELTKNALDKFNSVKNGLVGDREATYVTRFRNIISNNKTDFTSPKHTPNPEILKSYEPIAQTDKAFFNLIGKSPVDMVKEAAGRKYVTNRWLRIMGAFTASVFSITLLAQLGFGKIRNPHNLKKQVENETK